MGLCLIFSGLSHWSEIAVLPVVSLFLIYPFVLTVLNLVFCVRKPRDKEMRRTAVKIEIATLVLGVLFSLLLAAFSDINFRAHWTEALSGFEMHSPVLPEA